MASIYNCFLICPRDKKLTLAASCLPCKYRKSLSWNGDSCIVKCKASVTSEVITTIAESKNDSRGNENLIRMCKM